MSEGKLHYAIIEEITEYSKDKYTIWPDTGEKCHIITERRTNLIPFLFDTIEDVNEYIRNIEKCQYNNLDPDETMYHNFCLWHMDEEVQDEDGEWYITEMREYTIHQCASEVSPY